MLIDEFKELYSKEVDSINHAITGNDVFLLPQRISFNFERKERVFDILTDFNDFFSDEDYKVYDNPKDTINNNFVYNQVESEEEALCFFLQLKYNLCIGLETLCILRPIYTSGILNEVCNSFRNYDDRELRYVFSFYDSILKYPGVLKYFGYDKKSLTDLVELMSEGKLDVNSLFEENNKVVNTVYDLNKLDAFSESEVDSTVDDKYPPEFYNELKDFKYLDELKKAYDKGLYSIDFIKNYCYDVSIQDQVLQMIIGEYCSGNLDSTLLEQVKGNFYLSKILTDSKKNNLVFDKLLISLQNDIVLKDTYRYGVKLINALFVHQITQKDYLKYLALLNFDKFDFKELFYSCSEVEPFNLFVFKELINKMYNNSKHLDLPSDIGSLLCVAGIEGKYTLFTTQSIIENIGKVIDKIDAILHGRPLKFILMDNNKGLFILDSTIDNPINLGKVSEIRCSLDNYFDDTTKEVYSKFNSEMAVLRSNYISLKESVLLNEQIDSLILSSGSYMLYDNLFYRFNHDLLDFVGVLKSSSYKFFLKACLSLQLVQNKRIFLFQFLNVSFKAVHPDNYVSNNYGIGELTEDFTIDIYGISGFLNISIRTLVDSIDSVLLKLSRLDNLRMIPDPANNKLIIKGWS